MKIENFVNSLLPSMEKTRIRDELRQLREVIGSINVPAFKEAEKIFSKQAFVSDFAKDFDKTANRRVDAFDKNYVKTTYQALKMSLDSLDFISEQIEAKFSNDVMRDAMDYVNANLLQYSEMLSFLASYSRRLLLLTYALETNPAVEELSKGSSRDLAWLSKHKNAFMVCLNAALMKRKVIEDKIEDVPDFLVDPDQAQVVQETAGISKVDPFKAGLIPYSINPIYHLRIKVSEWQVNRYKLAKEEKQAIELHLLHLKETQAKNPNAKTERAIEYTEDRVNKMRYKLMKLEGRDE